MKKKWLFGMVVCAAAGIFVFSRIVLFKHHRIYAKAQIQTSIKKVKKKTIPMVSNGQVVKEIENTVIQTHPRVTVAQFLNDVIGSNGDFSGSSSWWVTAFPGGSKDVELTYGYSGTLTTAGIIFGITANNKVIPEDQATYELLQGNMGEAYVDMVANSAYLNDNSSLLGTPVIPLNSGNGFLSNQGVQNSASTPPPSK